MAELTEDVREYIGLIVKTAIAEYHDTIRPTTDDKIDRAIDVHSKTCQTGEEFRILKAKMIGVMVGIGLGSAGIGGAIASLVNCVL